MLGFLRKKHIAKIIFWGLLILILPAFVLWGTASISGSRDKGARFVGTIDNRKVSFGEFAEQIAGIRNQIILNYFRQPQVVDAFLKNKTLLANLAWNRLIILKEAAKHKIRIDDSEVASFLRSHPMFSRNGYFDYSVYEYALKYNFGMDARRFEETIRQNLAMQRLSDIIAKDVRVTDEEVLDDYRKDNEKFRILYILFEYANFLDKTKVGDDMAKTYYDAHKKEFALPLIGEEKAGSKTTEEAVAKFEDVRESIKSYLAETRAKYLCREYSQGVYKNITAFMEKENSTFAQAAAKFGLSLKESNLFSKSDYLDGIGESDRIVDAAVTLKADQISNPVETRKGIIIFKTIQIEKLDEKKFGEKKEEYYKNVLARKRDDFMESWLRGILPKTSLNIDLKDYEKYYR